MDPSTLTHAVPVGSPPAGPSGDELDTQNLPVDELDLRPKPRDAADELPRLLVMEGTTSRLVELPRDGALVVGRGLQADLVLGSSSVSRAHARITLEDGHAKLTDLGSHNGTQVNGVRVTSTRALQPSDVITIAGARLVFQCASEPRALAIGGAVALVADAGMNALYALVERLAKSDLPVLVHGETGSGKELVTSALHHWSKRTDRPLVQLNCAAVPENLFESELFGHDEGAFSGARSARPGLFEVAAGGTLVLDEIGELPPAIQPKLLRALETKRVARLGELAREREVDVRIVASTNRDLTAEVKAGRFRGDLYFRLSAASVWVPPLRERRVEIPVLARAILEDACLRANRPAMALSPGTLELFLGHRWPGNVRELKNLVEYAAATIMEPLLEPHHVAERLRAWHEEAPTAVVEPEERTDTLDPKPVFRPIDEELKELERTRMAAALRATGGNQKRAAELIQMPLRTFVAKLKQYDLRSDRQRTER